MRQGHDGFYPWIGFMTIFTRESMRYLKIAVQTIFAPFLSQLLFLAVFGGIFLAILGAWTMFTILCEKGLKIE
jgi:hypothetical protein